MYIKEIKHLKNTLGHQDINAKYQVHGSQAMGPEIIIDVKLDLTTHLSPLSCWGV